MSWAKVTELLNSAKPADRENARQLAHSLMCGLVSKYPSWTTHDFRDWAANNIGLAAYGFITNPKVFNLNKYFHDPQIQAKPAKKNANVNAKAIKEHNVEKFWDNMNDIHKEREQAGKRPTWLDKVSKSTPYLDSWHSDPIGEFKTYLWSAEGPEPERKTKTAPQVGVGARALENVLRAAGFNASDIHVWCLHNLNCTREEMLNSKNMILVSKEEYSYLKERAVQEKLGKVGTGVPDGSVMHGVTITDGATLRGWDQWDQSFTVTPSASTSASTLQFVSTDTGEDQTVPGGPMMLHLDEDGDLEDYEDVEEDDYPEDENNDNI